MNGNEYIVNSDFKLISPNLHDWEVRRIEFDLSNVTISLAQALEVESLYIQVRKVRSVSLFTDVVQNVVYDAYVFSPDAECNPLFGRVKNVLRIQRTLSTNERILFLEPAAGIEFALIGEDILIGSV